MSDVIDGDDMTSAGSRVPACAEDSSQELVVPSALEIRAAKGRSVAWFERHSEQAFRRRLEFHRGDNVLLAKIDKLRLANVPALTRHKNARDNSEEAILVHVAVTGERVYDQRYGWRFQRSAPIENRAMDFRIVKGRPEPEGRQERLRVYDAGRGCVGTIHLRIPSATIESYAASSGPLNRLRLTASVRMNRFGRGIAMAAAYGGPSTPPPAR
jgi:hypothetical protein